MSDWERERRDAALRHFRYVETMALTGQKIPDTNPPFNATASQHLLDTHKRWCYGGGMAEKTHCDGCQQGWPRMCPKCDEMGADIHVDEIPESPGVFRAACSACGWTGRVTIETPSDA